MASLLLRLAPTLPQLMETTPVLVPPHLRARSRTWQLDFRLRLRKLMFQVLNITRESPPASQKKRLLSLITLMRQAQPHPYWELVAPGSDQKRISAIPRREEIHTRSPAHPSPEMDTASAGSTATSCSSAPPCSSESAEPDHPRHSNPTF